MDTVETWEQRLLEIVFRGIVKKLRNKETLSESQQKIYDEAISSSKW